MNNQWFIVPWFAPYEEQGNGYTPNMKNTVRKYALYNLHEHDFAQNSKGRVRQYTTRSGARGVRSRLRKEGVA